MVKKILIIEDERFLAQLMSERLTKEGYQTAVANNGLEALDVLESFKPDLITLDLIMPHMNGFEFYQSICDAQGMPKYPILIVTAKSNYEKLFKDFFIDGFISKPFESQRFLEEVKLIINKKSQKKIDSDTIRVALIDSDAGQLGEIAKAFEQADFYVHQYDNAVLALEMITITPPDLVVVNLALKDISGDVLILRIQRMARTKTIPCILYIKGVAQHDPTVLSKLGEKTGVRVMAEFDKPAELVDVAKEELERARNQPPVDEE